MVEEVSIAIPRDPRYLGLVRFAITAVARRAGLDAKEAGEVEIAVDEALTRTIGHAWPEGRDAPHESIRVLVRIDDRALSITLVDHGAQAAPPDGAELDEYDLGGFGDFVIQTFMDEVEFTHRTEVGNELRLVRYIAGRERASVPPPDREA